MYRFNPLLRFPVLHPWDFKAHAEIKINRMITPLSNLVFNRMSDGIYYEFLEKENKGFTEWYSQIYEKYCGHILKQSFTPEHVLSEDELKKIYSGQHEDKTVDWVVIQEEVAMLIECKSSRFSLEAKTTNSRSDVDSQLNQLIKGMVQLQAIDEAINNDQIDHEQFDQVESVTKLIVTPEPLFGIFQRDYAKKYLKKLMRESKYESANKIDIDEYRFVTNQNLEAFQPHFSHGYPLSEVLKMINKGKPIFKIVDRLCEETGMGYGDSFLQDFDEQILDGLGMGSHLNGG